jgi:nicotinamide-nucleotide adenylyltransferase
MKALFLGRFQPFHNGHMEVIKEIRPGAESFIIVIGSAQESHTLDNPFTAGERYGMIKKSLVDENLNGVDIIPISDLNRYSLWVNYVETFVPTFDTIVTNNSITQRLFGEKGYEVVKPQLYNRERFSGEEIRRRILHNESWQDLVPKAVARIIEGIEGTERLRAIAGNNITNGDDDV